jgi:hypothetical protein
MQTNSTSSIDLSGPQAAMIAPSTFPHEASAIEYLSNYLESVKSFNVSLFATQDYTKELNAIKDKALHFLQSGRVKEALHAYHALYLLHLDMQEAVQVRIHKGDVLYWLGYAAEKISCHSVALRYYLLALCEDAIECNGIIDPNRVGTYHKLVIGYGFTPNWFHDLASEIYMRSHNEALNIYPEHMLIGVNSAVRVFQPIGYEFQIVAQSPNYLKRLIENLGNGSDGRAMERIASYLLSTIPGFHVTERVRSHSSDYDVLAEVPVEASRLYPYTGDVIVCECKDTEDATGFTSIAKLCRVLDSVKARAGIVFSRNGVSGKRNTLDAHREIIKVYQDRAILIVVVDVNDLKAVANGESFYSMLVEKFRRLRLDLRHE